MTASALASHITGTGCYSHPTTGGADVGQSEGEPTSETSVDETFDALISKLDSIIDNSSASQNITRYESFT